MDDDGVLLAVVLCVRKHERQQALGAKLRQRPEEGGDATVPGGDVRGGGWIATAGRGVERNALERRWGEAQSPVAHTVFVVELRVGTIQKEQVFPLYVVDERLRVDGLGTERIGVEQAEQQESGVAGLGRHAGDAADVRMGAAVAVNEL